MVDNDGWRKSSRSGAEGNDCVEARLRSGEFQVRDSKLDQDSPVFGMTPKDFTALLSTAKR
ncbi:DUF397 domain-containing protein [Glycomyces buryatensis]|uniref:DUF397 domain-containing protein n=1 Tax=Glycomyces buryatensis TaxID=2570927 RepID=UPI001FE3EAF1|nr:DUF397 domain-containing protein [Glycomyces buryatensis]